MPTVHVEANVSAEQLLQAVKQLDGAQLENFTQQVLALRAGRRTRAISAAEAELLLKINEGLPASCQHRYEELIAKRQAESLTQNEHQELMDLGKQAEQKEIERVQALSSLAQLRQVSLNELMHQLDGHFINP